MREIVLHIGLPKTATSYLQRWLGCNAHRLEKAGIWVPSKQMTAHGVAVEAISDAGLRQRPDILGIRKAMPYKDAFSTLSKAVKNSTADICLISSEYFTIADPKIVHERLAVFGLPVRIVVMLRRQDKLMESGYNQSVKAMGLAGPMGGTEYQRGYDWFALLTQWQSHFGEGRIGVLNFDRSSKAKSVLEDIMQLVDPRMMPQNLASDFEQVPVENESLPADLLEFKRLANSFGKFGLERLLYGMMDAGYFGQPFRMKPENARKVVEAFRESNQRVSKEILNTDEPLFPDYGEPGESEGIDLFGKLPIETLARVFAFHLKQLNAEIEKLKADIALLKK